MTKQQIITPVLIVAIVGSIAVLSSPTTSAVASLAARITEALR